LYQGCQVQRQAPAKAPAKTGKKKPPRRMAKTGLDGYDGRVAMNATFPENIISACIIVCERVLTEKDDAPTAVRLIDLLVLPQPHPEPLIDAVRLGAVAIIKGWPDGNGHIAKGQIIGPSGKVDDIPGSLQTELKPKIGDGPGGATIIIDLSLQGKSLLGTYYICLLLDDLELCRTPFTVIRQPASTPDEQQTP
jgi:hypothetical protein